MGGRSNGVVDGDRGVRGVAQRVRYVSWNDSSESDGRGMGVVCDCHAENRQGGWGNHTLTIGSCSTFCFHCCQ